MLRSSGVLTALDVSDKKQLLGELADAAALETGLKSRDLFQAMLHRERLGSTGLGRGIAIPHGRIPGLRRMVCLFARLERPIAFDAIDGEPVDLVFLLLAPEDAGADHLKALARLSRLLRDGRMVDLLRNTRDPAALFAILTAQDMFKRAG